MKKLFIFFTFFITQIAFAQTKENFDISSFNAPKKWKKQTTEKAIQFSKEDVTKGTYCLITLYKSIPGKSNAKENFDLAWESLIKESLSVSTLPEMQPASTENGWEAQSGYALFETDGNKGLALLVTSSGFEKMVNIVVLTNSDIYQKELDAFLESVSLKKPTGITKQANNKETNTVKPQIVTTTKKDGFTFTTSNFNDGWTSTVSNDYVLVEKAGNSVYLLYAVPYNTSQFSGTGLRDAEYYWDQYVTQLFTTKTKQFNDGGSIGFKPPYMEGYAIDKRTGKSCFIGMYLNIIPNAVKLVIGTASDEAAFRQLFPRANDEFTSDLSAMVRYNKFAVASSDLPGTWQEGGTNTAQWYYTSPSGYEGYAGMTAAARSATFNFHTDGTYSSIHNGATGAVGSMQTFQQNYKGKYTVKNWEIIATNRWQGKTETMSAHFEAVRGGRILHMANMYKLVKVK